MQNDAPKGKNGHYFSTKQSSNKKFFWANTTKKHDNSLRTFFGYFHFFYAKITFWQHDLLLIANGRCFTFWKFSLPVKGTFIQCRFHEFEHDSRQLLVSASERKYFWRSQPKKFMIEEEKHPQLAINIILRLSISFPCQGSLVNKKNRGVFWKKFSRKHHTDWSHTLFHQRDKKHSLYF